MTDFICFNHIFYENNAGSILSGEIISQGKNRKRLALKLIAEKDTIDRSNGWWWGGERIQMGNRIWKDLVYKSSLINVYIIFV